MVLDVILEFLPLAFFYTGECIIYIVRLGRKKPRWNLNKEGKKGKFLLLTTPSVWIGFLFWALIFACLVLSIITSEK